MDKIEVVRSEGVEPSSDIKNLPAPTLKSVPLREKRNFERFPHLPGGEGYIYFIRAGSKVKIGFSTRPLIRLANLQTSHHEKLEVLGTKPGTKKLEADLHHRFRDFHVRGEWFQAHPLVLEYFKPHRSWRHRPLKLVPAPAPIKQVRSDEPIVSQFVALGRELSQRRHLMPADAKPHASNLIEQIDNIWTVADAERLRPHMARSALLLAQRS